MNKTSRTKRTLQNSRVSLLLFLVQILVGFYSRKIFLDYLGAEVLGLNTTLGNILSFMNLAELGIGMAMATSLYKPIYEDDHETICEIISVEGLLFRRVAIAMLGMGAFIMLALPWFFPSTSCGIGYVYVAFAVFLFGSITSYLWNYRQVLISADQKNFKLLPWMHAVRYVVIGLQIVCLLVLQWGAWGWLCWEFAGNVAMVFVINHMLKKEYPWLKASRITGKELLHKYHHLIVKTKQLFIHKIAQFVLEQTPPLIIYAFVSLSMVAYYGNYMVIIGYVATSVNIVFAGMGASIGSLVAEGNKKHTLDVFWELLSSRIWIASLACYGLYLFLPPFIHLWIGPQYILSETTMLLIILGAFIRMSRTIIDSFKDAYQLFGDVWAPVAEAIVNLCGSILFGYLWGLNGILLGSNLSLVLIVLLWKPYYLLRHGLKYSYTKFCLQYSFHILIILFCACFSTYIRISVDSNDGIVLLLSPTLSFLLYVFSSYGLLMLTVGGMRMFTQRIIRIISHHL